MFSVIIPTFNRDISRVIQSLCLQTDKNFEVIIIDDCSTTPPLIPFKVGLNITYLRNTKNLGPAGSRHLGARAARGEYLAFLDDDDEWMPQKLATVRSHVEQLSGVVDLVVHGAEIILPNEGLQYVSSNRPNDPLYERLLVSNVVGGTPLVTILRKAYLSAGGFDTTLRADEDYELWLRMVRDGAKVIYVDEVLVRCFYITRQKSVSKMIANRVIAHRVISNRYLIDLKKLSWFQQRNRHALFYFSLAYSACLMGDYRAYDYLLRSFWYRPRIKTIGVIVVYLLGGVKAVVEVRNRIVS